MLENLPESNPECTISFEGLEDGVAFELYWAEFNHNDIVRESCGKQK